MCLTNIEKITPQEDIICYKLFVIDPKVCDSDMRSPFYSKSWKIGKMETLKRNAATVYSSYYNGHKNHKIQGGAYHSYQNIADIPVEFLLFSEIVVCKCIIPKSSKYVYSGYNNENKSSKGYASQKLKPVEFVHVDKCELFNMLYYADFLDEQRQKFNERCKE